MQDGSKIVLQLSDKPQLTFSYEEMTVATKAASVSFPYQGLKNITYKDFTVDIKDADTDEKDFDDVDYNYSGYTFKMPCGFKWCDRGSTTYYYVENPDTGEGETKEFHFTDRAAMCNILAEHGFADVKMLLSYFNPQFMTRVDDAGTHQETYDKIIKRYKK